MAFTERSAQTRAKILDAARRRFAADGYDRTTIRAVAADASIDPSMVMRYYGSKSELYAAAAEISLAVPDLGEAEGAGARYAAGFLGRWEQGENFPEEVLLRTAATRPDAAARVQETFDTQIVPAMRAAFPDVPDIRERAALALSQSLGVVYCRYLLRLEPLVSMSTETLVAAVGEAVQAHLTRELT